LDARKMNDNVSIEDLKVLSEETRLKILLLINEKGELGLNELSNMTKRAKSTISEHLKILLENGFIERIRIEKGYYYKLTEKGRKILENIQIEGRIPKISEGKMFRWEIDVETIRLEVFIPLLTGISMIFLSGIPRIAILLSIINGFILGILDLKIRDLIKGGIIFSCITAVIAAIKIGIMEMLITFIASIIIYMCVGGFTWITIKTIAKWVREK